VVPGHDWPLFRGDARRSGCAADGGAVRPPLELLWRLDTDGKI